MGCIRFDQYNPLVHDIISIHDTEDGCNEDCGVCCLPNGLCVDNTQTACNTAGGTWNAGVTCEDVICPSPSPSPSLSIPPTPPPPSVIPSPSPTTPPPIDCDCFTITISYGGSTLIYRNTNGSTSGSSTLGNTISCTHPYSGYTLKYQVSSPSVTCEDGVFTGTFTVGMVLVDSGGSAVSTYYSYLFDLDGNPISGWTCNSIPSNCSEDCPDQAIPTPTISITGTCCTSFVCNWLWDATGEVAGYPAWYNPDEVSECTANGCGNCNYPGFEGTTNGEETTTPCT